MPSVSPPGRRDLGDQTLLVDCVRGVLARADSTDWQVRPGDVWCRVQPPGGRSRMQGWKLHLSATPLSAPLVLARAATILVRHECAFKFATDLARVAELVSRRVDRGAGGKFITAYPDCDDEQLRDLAEELHRATAGLPGPGILCDRPYRPGSLLHYRYGVFSGVRVLGNDGSYEAMLLSPEGVLELDQRRAWFSPPSWVPRDPFTGEYATTPPAATAGPPKPVLLHDRYVVREVIRHAFSGGVYRADDQRSGRAVIVKQGRPHTDANAAGRDVRTARRHEAAMLERLRPSGVTPQLVEVFEQQGDLFLVQEMISGRTLREWVAENCDLGDGGGAWGPPPTAVARIAAGLVDLVELVHGRNLVLRDFNPNNVMVTDDAELRLIDLEMLNPIGERVTKAFTMGYASPEQMDAPPLGAVIDPTADLYSLGATLFYLATGIDPILPDDEPPARPRRDRVRTWLEQLGTHNESARRLAPVVLELLHEDPERRPGFDRVRELLADGDRHTRAPSPPRPVDPTGPELRRWIDDALGYLLGTMDATSRDRLWPSREFGMTTDPLNVQHGAAGVLGVLNRARHHMPRADLRSAVATTAGWITRWASREPRVLPGLHFGRAGTAWAVLEAGHALGDEAVVSAACDMMRRFPVRWPNPDVCHGMAGAGFAQLRAWEITGDAEFLDRARQAADALRVAAQERDGELIWPISREFASNLAGLVHYGFAHGVAGVGAFLLAVVAATGDETYLDLVVRAADTLVSVAQVKDGAAYWPSSERGKVGLTSWCSGSSGVGTFLVRAGHRTGDERFQEVAAQAAVAVYRSRWHAGTAQCHGLAGDGEFLLDLADVCGDDRYRDWAAELAASIYCRHALRNGRAVAPDESHIAVTADFNTGLAGVLAFLLRLSFGGRRLWLPDSFTGVGIESRA